MSTPINNDDEKVMLKLPSWKIWLVMIVISLLFFIDMADRSVIGSVVPLLKKEFDLSDGQIGLLSTVLLAMVGLLAIPISWLIDRWRRGKMISIIAVIWSLAQLFTGLGTNFVQLLTGRAVLGVGEASFNSGAQAMIMSTLKKKIRATITGIFVSMGAIGTAAGVMLGGSMGATYGWRAAFIALAIPGIILGILAWFLPDYKNPPKEALSQKGEDKTSFGSTMKSVLKNRSLVTLYIAYGLMVFFLNTMIFWLPSYLIRYAGMNMATAGSMSGLVLITAIISAPIGGLIGDRVARKNSKYRVIVIWIGALIAVIGFSSALLFNIWQLFFIAVFGLTFLVPPQHVACQELVPSYQRATAYGVYTFCMMALGGLWGPVVMGMISDASSLKTAFWVCAAIAFVASFGYLLLYKFFEADYNKSRELEKCLLTDTN